MIIRKQKDIPAFLDAVQKCRGEVIMETDMGDRLNLKSTLSQFVFIAGYDRLREMRFQIKADDADLPLLLQYLGEGEN